MVLARWKGMSHAHVESKVTTGFPLRDEDVGIKLEVSCCVLLLAMGDSRTLQAPAEGRLNADVPLLCLVFLGADHAVAESVHRCPTAQGARGPF
jgi:hypothetical protein